MKAALGVVGGRWVRWWLRVGLALVPLVLLGACDAVEDEAAVDERPAVRSVVVEGAAPARTVRLPGVVQAREVAALAFAVDGTVQVVRVALGDRVTTDQLLALLDPERYLLQRAARTAEVAQAEAALREQRAEFERQEVLFREGWISEAAFERIRRGFETAVAELEAAEQRLALAERDLADTELRAPHGGWIAERRVEPGEEVAAGQPVLLLERTNGFEVAVLLPETLVAAVEVGDAVAVRVLAADVVALGGTVAEIGSWATEANAFPLTVALDAEAAGLRSGMTAEVSLALPRGPASAVLVPIEAVLLEAPEEAYVFVHDQDAGVVQRRPVRLGALHDGEIEVVDGIAAGDRLVAAGVEFLRDGQRVRAADEGL
ncbi:MAG: efflux RND transporter periplasmic adaptor subunit [Geminicoccaceae bacterium]|nr:MAG: efflux RND transporter periplasmic adaptor subunit [Geminicoccaceae bacterium]